MQPNTMKRVHPLQHHHLLLPSRPDRSGARMLIIVAFDANAAGVGVIGGVVVHVILVRVVVVVLVTIIAIIIAIIVFIIVLIILLIIVLIIALIIATGDVHPSNPGNRSLVSTRGQQQQYQVRTTRPAAPTFH